MLTKWLPLWLCTMCSRYCLVRGSAGLNQPNIVIILADDLGYDDVSLHGSNQIPTPNIDSLGMYGISLRRYYVTPMCSPSRSSLMTGKYPSSVGMQRFVIPSEQPYGLGLDEKLLPEYLKEAGYRTNMVGKWHLGFFRHEYTPNSRGFDEFYGYYGPYIDYFNHSLSRISLPPHFEKFAPGYDMRNNFDVNWDTIGQYATDLFTDKAVEMIDKHDQKKPMFLYVSHLAPHAGNEYDPLQVREEDLLKFNYIEDPNRRKYAAMVSRLDDSVGRIVQALERNNMLDDSIVLFMADNGAPVVGQHSNAGSNFPFKGQKDSPWEGAARAAAAIWSPWLRKRQRNSEELYHISDWLPTFSKLAGVPNHKLSKNLDGVNIWPSLAYKLPSPRFDVLINADRDEPYSSYIRGNYKLVNGSRLRGQYDTWLSSRSILEENIDFRNNYGEHVLNSLAGRAISKYAKGRYKATPRHMESLRAKITCNEKLPANEGPTICNPYIKPCLFDIVQDPCETTNLAYAEPEVLEVMLQVTEQYMRKAKPPRNQPSDPKANPKYYNNTWSCWVDELKSTGKQVVLVE